MSQAIKAVFSNVHQAARLHLHHRLARSMCNFTNKDFQNRQAVVSTPTTAAAPTSEIDFLMKNLKNATSPSSVLEIVAHHNGIMNNKHIIQALQSLFSLQKQGGSSHSTREILKHPDFAKLCYRLKRQAGTIELNDTIAALKVVCYVGVPSHSTIVQVLLQLIRQNINHLSLPQIMFVDFLITQMNQSPLVEALKIALPLVFEINLPIKMDRSNVAHLAEYLYFASRVELSEDAVKLIAQELMHFSDSDFDGKIAKSLVWSICDLPSYEFLVPLLKKALKILVVHLDEIDYTTMESTLMKLISRFYVRTPQFYDEVFFDSCANYIIDHNLGFDQSIYILRKFARVNHFNKYLVDYIAKKALEQPDLIRKADAGVIYSIAVGVAMTEYRPPRWDELKALLEETEGLTRSERKEIIWMKFASSLCSLGIFKIDLLNKVLQEPFLREMFKKTYKSDVENYITIWQSIKMLRPDLACLLSPNYNPEELQKKNSPPPDFYPLEGALHKALGGDKYVKNGIYSKLGHFIDHAVVFRSGGYPVAANWDDVNSIEDFVLPPNHQIVSIMALNHFNYPINTKQLRNSIALSINFLESRGFPVVPVCLETWENLADFEKVPYLMQAIKEKMDSDLRLSENVV